MIAVPFELLVTAAICAWAALIIVCTVTLHRNAHPIDVDVDGRAVCRKCGPDFLCTEVC